jgi:radical S-adenosyl methionine domain-containing protein 2
MASSYLLLDEYMCFLDKGEGMMTQSKYILDVGVKKAMEQIVWDKKSCVDRGELHDWGRADMKPKQERNCGGGLDKKKLKW